MRYRISFLLVLGYVVCLTAEAQTSMSLQEALKAARVNNLFLKTERYSIEAGQADVVSAKLRPNPALNNQTLQLANSKHYQENTTWNNGHNRRWIRNASATCPLEKALIICLISPGTRLPATLTTPVAPTASFGRVRLSSPL